MQRIALPQISRIRLLALLIPLALLLTYCDLGNFEPGDIFTRRPLEDDAAQLVPEDGSNCGTTFFANQGDIAPTDNGFEIKGSLYFENMFGEAVYFTNGEFTAITNNAGDLVTLTGFGLARFPDAGIFEQSQLTSAITANMELNTGDFFNADGALPLDGSTCYIRALVNDGPALLTTAQGAFEYNAYYLAPTDPFVLFEGKFDLNAVAMKEGLVGISYSGLIPFVPPTSEDVQFEAFDGHLFTRGILPFTVNDVPIISEGESVVNAAPPGFDDEAKAFFDGNPAAYHQGSLGDLAISYRMLDDLLAGHGFYQMADTAARQRDTLAIREAVAVKVFELGTEQLDFAGRYADTVDIYEELLPGHPILENLTLTSNDSVGLYGTYGTNQELWGINAIAEANLALNGIADLTFEQAVLSITNNTVEFSGLFISPFQHIPNILVAGTIDEDGDLVLQGTRTLAVFYGNKTLPTTFFMTVQIEDGQPSFRVDAQADDCNGNDCTVKAVEVTYNFDTDFSRLCIDNGASCTN